MVKGLICDTCLGLTAMMFLMLAYPLGDTRCLVKDENLANTDSPTIQKLKL